MKNFSLIALLLMSASPAFAQDAPDPDLPAFVIESKGFYALSAGYLQLQAPSGKMDLAQIDLNYLWVNQGVAQLYQLRFGLNKESHSLSLGYGLGIGPRRGIIHAGLLLNLGYARLCDKDKYVHAMVVGFSPMVVATLWENWQFFLTAGWSMIPLSSQDIPKSRAMAGFNIGAGVAVSID
jgi:hypothetical protein